MQTIEKGLSLLQLFSERCPEIGLTEIARRSGFDKATTRRFLLALKKHGFVEQNASTRAYRLGPGVLRLARVREAVSPIASVAHAVLEALVDSVGETAHFSLQTGEALGTIGVQESNQSNRVMLEKGESLPLHATASGIAYLAFAKPEIAKSVLRKKLKPYTDKTVVDPEEIASFLRKVKRSGSAVLKSSYEEGVCGIASPVFADDGYACGAVAVAVPISRASRQAVARIKAEVVAAANQITRATGAEPDPVVAQASSMVAA